MSCDGYNVLCNNGRAAGQLVEHLHFHIIPRNLGDGIFERWPVYKYKQGLIETIAAKICRKF
jgi:histidine triad (HIT) family protein